jgi:hypothetical protein
MFSIDILLYDDTECSYTAICESFIIKHVVHRRRGKVINNP